MKHFALNGQLREVGNKAAIKAFRKQGLVLCNLYGQGLENVLFTVSAKDLKPAITTPYSHIIDLNLDGKAYTAVFHEFQWHPVTDECLHIDFLAVSENKPVAINVPIVITGHSKGVQQGGKFVPGIRTLRISAMLNNLPDDITVDITELGLDKRIKASDVKVDGVTILTDKDAIVCGVKMTRNAKSE